MNASTQTATQTPARADRRKSVVDPREHRLGGEQSSRLSSLGIAGNGKRGPSQSAQGIHGSAPPLP